MLIHSILVKSSQSVTLQWILEEQSGNCNISWHEKGLKNYAAIFPSLQSGDINIVENKH